MRRGGKKLRVICIEIATGRGVKDEYGDGKAHNAGANPAHSVVEQECRHPK
jgi:hypothetical protein